MISQLSRNGLSNNRKSLPLLRFLVHVFRTESPSCSTMPQLALLFVTHCFITSSYTYRARWLSLFRWANRAVRFISIHCTRLPSCFFSPKYYLSLIVNSCFPVSFSRDSGDRLMFSVFLLIGRCIGYDRTIDAMLNILVTESTKKVNYNNNCLSLLLSFVDALLVSLIIFLYIYIWSWCLPRNIVHMRLFVCFVLFMGKFLLLCIAEHVFAVFVYKFVMSLSSFFRL